MKTQNEHTPTPWHRNVSPAWKYPIYAEKNGNPKGRNWEHIAMMCPDNPNAEADLDFIVRAVNSHGALLSFATKHHEVCEECEGTGRIYNNADSSSGQWVACPYADAIAKAEGIL